MICLFGTELLVEICAICDKSINNFGYFAWMKSTFDNYYWLEIVLINFFSRLFAEVRKLFVAWSAGTNKSWTMITKKNAVPRCRKIQKWLVHPTPAIGFFLLELWQFEVVGVVGGIHRAQIKFAALKEILLQLWRSLRGFGIFVVEILTSAWNQFLFRW